MRALGRGGTAVMLVFVGAVGFAQWLPEHGLRRPSQAKLQVGSRVVVRSVKFLKAGRGREEAKQVQAGTPVRLQAELESSPRGALPEGTLVLFRLFGM